ncbi:MAG: HAMP domain-containing histidine kinase [Ruminococcus sp.]|nr:HAMP domain-containing histidine kinase [Ruminococcus sp.]
MNFLKNKATRIAAALLMVISVAVSLAFCSSAWYDYDKIFRRMQNTENEKLVGYHEEMYKVSHKLWLFDKLYVRNLDDDGKLTGNKFYQQSIIENLKAAGLMDEKGNITLPETNVANYAVGWEGVVFSNFDDDFSFDNAEDNNYAYISTRYVHRYYSNVILNVGFYDCNWYSNMEGMEYFYDGYRGYAVFDYDTSKLESYKDRLGAKIYINEDGTTPIPTDRNTDFNGLSFDADVQEDGNVYANCKYDTHASEEPYGYMYICPVDKIIQEHETVNSECSIAETKFENRVVQIIPLVGFAVILALYLLIAGGYDTKTGKFRLGAIDKIWAELYLALIGAMFIAAIGFLKEINNLADNISIQKTSFILLTTSIVTAIYTVGFVCVNSFITRLKCRSLIDTSLCGKIIKKFFRLSKEEYKRIEESLSNKEKYRNDVFVRRFTVRTLLFTVAGIMICLISLFWAVEVLPFLALAVIAVFYHFNMKDLRELSKLGEHVANISKGDYSPVLVEKTSAIYSMTENLNNMAEGIEKVVEKQVSAERMKIDLVTNVSHDLKTPLTSIVSYVDLLSQEELSPAAQDYVKILETKTDRLRDIVADLFDIAKATSKNDIKLEQIDAVVLTKQVLGDMEDKIKKSGRKLVTDIIPEKAPIIAEGKKLYRVLQNVIDNSLKYSLDGTRVFLKLIENDGTVCIELRNTASYEMKFTPEEITERFARGDKSRTSEGSGLGLSIAKSFTEACGGQFAVDIDGDVFEIFVRFSLLT